MIGDLIIYGTGALALEVEEYFYDCLAAGTGLQDGKGNDLTKEGNWRIVGVISSDRFRLHEMMNAERWIPIDAAPSELKGRWCIVAVGDPRLRCESFDLVVNAGATLITIIHPSCRVSKKAEVREGSILAPLSFVAHHALIGSNVLLNRYASVGHDTRVGDHTVLSPYACLNGHVILGSECFLGTHAIVTPGLSVGGRCKVAAGSVVFKNFGSGFLLSGNPARGRRFARNSLAR
jgi:sugar O-acyltransferase (sialic acid O-acetyltransferase NeuD family)